MMGIQVVGHRVMIKPLSVEDVDDVFASAKKAGVQLLESTEDAQKRKNAVDRGTVIGVGHTAFKDFGGKPWCKVGDTVVYARYAGKQVTDPVDDTQYTIINDEDVIAIVNKD